MPTLRKVEIAPPATAASDPRVGQLLGTGLAPGEAPAAVIVGFPTDEGVRRNGGRPGAAEGPGAIRRALYRMTPDAGDFERHVALLRRTVDAGDLVAGSDLEADQAALGEALAPWLRQGSFVLVLGGGHETAYGHFLGHAAAGNRVEILNLDAHADVRELEGGKGHSGSPFRQALLHPSGACRRYRVAGLAPQSVARDHLAWLEARGGRGWTASAIDAERVAGLFAGLSHPALCTFDLDALDQAYAPGVSAPAARGLAPAPWLEAAFLAGATAAVASADVCELCPAHDEGGRTARLAALTAWEILRGLSQRPAPGVW
ncbi:MAG: formimidoylglutamase [Deltaproteobacteria bacterium]|nr:formimidoylglutamase [Deltaproteobacteria bacterium]